MKVFDRTGRSVKKQQQYSDLQPAPRRNPVPKPAPQPELKPSEISDYGDVPVEASKPKIDNRVLFRSSSQGEEEADNSISIDENSLYSGGCEDEATRTADTPAGLPSLRQRMRHSLSGRSVAVGFPVLIYNDKKQGLVVVDIVVNQEGQVTDVYVFRQQ
ncbi:MAG: hypothetical protein LBF59_00365 [Prevotellaceae bacterium]|nr:hypothetical protein [Prevotellaceae bacterium]